MKNNKQTEGVTIKPIKVATFKLKIKGMSNLLTHKFSDNAKQGLLDKQAGKSKERTKRTKEVIKKEVEDCIHRTPTGKPGFPTSGFKKAMVSVASSKIKLMEGVDGKLVKGSFFIIGNLTEIKFKTILIRMKYRMYYSF